MTNKLFSLVDGGFVVGAPDGSTAFDSRRPSQRIYMTGTSDLLGPDGGSPYTTKQILYGKTFDKIPYVVSAGRIITPGYAAQQGAQHIYCPGLQWSFISSTGQQFFNGNFTSAFKSDLYLGNGWQTLAVGGGAKATVRFIYAVFENFVEN